MVKASLVVVLVSVLAVFIAASALADEVRTHPSPGLGDYDTPFWPDGTYRSDVRSPSDFLGFELGGRPVRHDEVMRYFRYLGENFANASLFEMGHTYEGRALVYLSITSESNARNLEDIQRDAGRLADPRRLSGRGEAERIMSELPAVAWMAYGIHGDELSSCDAAVALAYQLLAGTDDVTTKIRDEVVVLIDPVENPDGRTRWLQQMQNWNSVVPNSDVQSFHHRGFWPYGRTNHYLFDMNRDWFALVHPESRARIRAILEWSPHYFLDAHEMGALDTYLFSPPRAPFNQYMPSHIYKWWDIVAKDQGAAFDRYGWDYYTREWNEEFFPGYGSSWGIYIGAVGMLYEQSRATGGQVKRRDGTIMTYRETVHHQFISSMANLSTVANNRRMLLEDFHQEKRRAVGAGRDRTTAAFVFPPAANHGRIDRLMETLRLQNIEVEVAQEAFKLSRARASTGPEMKGLSLPAGSMIVRVAQPLRALVEVILHFDIRMETEILELERRERLKHNRSKLYDTTGWSLALAYNVECYFTDKLPRVSTQGYETEARTGGITDGNPQYGYAFDNVDDRSYVLLARLLDRGINVWSARKPFLVGEREFGRGAFLVRRSGNPGLDEARLDALARDVGVDVYGVNTALGAPLADLGGNEFALLQRPRIGLVGGADVSTYEFGAVWHLLDSRMKYKTSTLDIGRLGRTDLRKYNVLVLPNSRGAQALKQLLGDAGLKKLKTWVREGGTLIATGATAAALADTSIALSGVRLKRQVLDKISQYDSWLEWTKSAEAPKVDSLEFWEAKKSGEESEAQPAKQELERLKEADELARRLRPQGAILGAELDAEHWLAFGERSPVPLLVSTDFTYLAKQGIDVPARYSPGDQLRLSGLLWPEARERWGETAYATRERVGNGQIVLFAYQPNFRGFFHGGERLLQNAIFLGPGFGTSTPLEW